jgi:hypothetical protein
MDDNFRAPVELTESDMDVVAGGYGGFDLDIGNHVSQINRSVNYGAPLFRFEARRNAFQASSGNNNNGISGNMVIL